MTIAQLARQENVPEHRIHSLRLGRLMAMTPEDRKKAIHTVESYDTESTAFAKSLGISKRTLYRLGGRKTVERIPKDVLSLILKNPVSNKVLELKGTGLRARGFKVRNYVAPPEDPFEWVSPSGRLFLVHEDRVEELV